jgi:outer membrane immunogenic protein
MKMIKMVLAVLLFGLLAAGSHAQTPKADVSIGYSDLHLNNSGGYSETNLNGFTASGAFHFDRWVGVVADLGVNHGSPGGVDTTTTTYTFGPRISARVTKRFVPFGEALVGGAHFSASFSGISGSVNPLAFAFGGGVDLGVARRIAVRPQIDYFGFRSNGSTEGAERIAVSLVFNL